MNESSYRVNVLGEISKKISKYKLGLDQNQIKDTYTKRNKAELQPCSQPFLLIGVFARN